MSELDKELEVSEGEKQEPRLYELGYHLLPTLSEGTVPEEAGRLKDAIEKLKGVVAGDRMPQPISLAYAIPKKISERRTYFETAFFGSIRFTMAPDSLVELKKELRNNKSILRFIVVKTTEVRASSAKKMSFLRPKPTARKEMTEKKVKPEKVLSEEELEKTIKELVSD